MAALFLGKVPLRLYVVNTHLTVGNERGSRSLLKDYVRHYPKCWRLRVETRLSPCRNSVDYITARPSRLALYSQTDAYVTASRTRSLIGPIVTIGGQSVAYECVTAFLAVKSPRIEGGFSRSQLG
jgi:hypothetical protein